MFRIETNVVGQTAWFYQKVHQTDCLKSIGETFVDFVKCKMAVVSGKWSFFQ